MTCRRTTGDWHLDADDARYAPSDGIGDRPGDALGNTYGLGVLHRFGDSVGNLLDTGLLFVVADRVGNLLGYLFLHHATDTVAVGLGSLFGNQATDTVGVGLGSLFGNHATDTVGVGLGSLFGNHATYTVGVSLGLFFGNHATDAVSAGLGLFFSHVTTDGVRNRFLDHLSFVSDARNFAFLDLGDPNTFANLSGRTLDFLDSTFSWYVDAALATVIPRPATGILDPSSNHAARTFAVLGFPAATADLHGLGVMDWFADHFTDFTFTRFVDWLTNVIAGVPRLRLPNRLADGIADFPCLGFPDGFANRVADAALTRFVDRLADGIADVSCFRLPDRFANRITDCFLASFVDWLANGIADFACLGFPDRFANRTARSSITCFVNRLADRVLAVAVTRFLDVLDAVHLLIFIDRFVNSSITGLLLLLVDNLASRFHNGVTRWLCTAGGDGLVCLTTRFTSNTPVGSKTSVRPNYSQQDDQAGHSKSDIHSPKFSFSLCFPASLSIGSGKTAASGKVCTASFRSSFHVAERPAQCAT